MLIVLFLLALTSTFVLVRTIFTDGYGSRPIPPSRHDDLAARRLR